MTERFVPVLVALDVAASLLDAELTSLQPVRTMFKGRLEPPPEAAEKLHDLAGVLAKYPGRNAPLTHKAAFSDSLAALLEAQDVVG